MGKAEQVRQPLSTTNSAATRYWIWRFDRPDDPIEKDNFWGKTVEQCMADLQVPPLNPGLVRYPASPGDVELVVDPYFPADKPTAPPELRGRAAHPKGRNGLWLDLHVEYARDARIY